MEKHFSTLTVAVVLISSLILIKAEKKDESIKDYNQGNLYEPAISYSRKEDLATDSQYQPVTFKSNKDYSAHQSIYSLPSISTYQQVSYVPDQSSQLSYQSEIGGHKQPASYHEYSSSSAKSSEDQKKTVILAIPVKLAIHVPPNQSNYGYKIKPTYNNVQSNGYTSSSFYEPNEPVEKYGEEPRQQTYHSVQTYNYDQAKSADDSERTGFDSNESYNQINYKSQPYVGNQLYENAKPIYSEDPKNEPAYRIYNKRTDPAEYEKKKELSTITGPSLTNVKGSTSYLEVKPPSSSGKIYRSDVLKEKQYKNTPFDDDSTFSLVSSKNPNLYSSSIGYDSDQEEWQNDYLRDKNTDVSSEAPSNSNNQKNSHHSDRNSYRSSLNKEKQKKISHTSYESDDDYDSGSSGIETYTSPGNSDSLENDPSYETGTGIQMGEMKNSKNGNNFANSDGSFYGFTMSNEAESPFSFAPSSFASGSGFSFGNSLGSSSYGSASGLSLANPDLLFGLSSHGNGNNLNEATWANMGNKNLQLPATTAGAYGTNLIDLSSLYGTLMKPLNYPINLPVATASNPATNHPSVLLASSLLYEKPDNVKFNKFAFSPSNPSLPLKLIKGSSQFGSNKYRPSSILASLYSSSATPVKTYLGSNAKSILGSGIGGGFRLSSVFKPSTYISPLKYLSALDNFISQIYKML